MNEIELLVASLAEPSRRDAAFAELVRLGPGARDAVCEGLGDGRWEVRRWCLYWLFQFGEPGDAPLVTPLLHDPRAKVRHGAVIVLSQIGGEAAIPPLLERALEDESSRVRRQAVSCLAYHHPHPDLARFLASLRSC